MKNKVIFHWLLVCVVPMGLILWFHFSPAQNRTDFLINGIIMACAATFLFKYIGITAIMAHLQQDLINKKQALYQLIPIVLFILYIIYYFLN